MFLKVESRQKISESIICLKSQPTMTYFTACIGCSVVRKGSPDPFRYEALLLFLPTSSQLDYLGHQADLLMNMWKLGSEHRLHRPLYWHQTSNPSNKDKYRRKGKGRRCYFGDRIYSTPCPARTIGKNNRTNSSSHPGAINPILQIVLMQNG